MHKHTYESVKAHFESEGYKLLATEYVNPLVKLPFKCPSGHEGSIRYNNFRRGHRCRACSEQGYYYGNTRRSLKEAQEIFRAHNMVLLATEYVNASTRMSCICSCGTVTTNSITNVLNGGRCKACCAITHNPYKAGDYSSLDLRYWAEVFTDKGLTLTKYTGLGESAEYRCSCGTVVSVGSASVYNLFTAGVCETCLTTRRLRNMKLHQSKIWARWSRTVKIRDSYTCQKCGSKRKLHAHHIVAVCVNPDLKFHVANGIAFCQECHKQLHSLFGLATDKRHVDLFLGVENDIYNRTACGDDRLLSSHTSVHG